LGVILCWPFHDVKPLRKLKTGKSAMGCQDSFFAKGKEGQKFLEPK
jgi:hypothetical protein